MTSVNGLELPGELVDMLSAGLWKIPENQELLKDVGIEDVSDLEFLSLAAMTQNTDALKRMAAGERGELFGLSSGGEGPLEEGRLDVTKAVMIAATRGQEALCLDYSVGASPRVVVTRYGPGGVTWVEAAKSLGALLDSLGIGPE